VTIRHPCLLALVLKFSDGPTGFVLLERRCWEERRETGEIEAEEG